MQLNLLEEKIRERLQERARIIGKTPETEIPHLETIFEQVAVLGQLLHEARQFLETPLTAMPSNTDQPDPETVWLWERGLALPKEVESGELSALVHHYVEKVLQQRNTATQRLSFDIDTLNTLLSTKSKLID